MMILQILFNTKSNNKFIIIIKEFMKFKDNKMYYQP